MHFFKNDSGHVIGIEDNLWPSVLKNEPKIVETTDKGLPLLKKTEPTPIPIIPIIPDVPKVNYEATSKGVNQLEPLKEEKLKVTIPEKKKNATTRTNIKRKATKSGKRN